MPDLVVPFRTSVGAASELRSRIFTVYLRNAASHLAISFTISSGLFGWDFSGFNFWLAKLNQFNGNYTNAEMVKAFLSSIEYRQRFQALIRDAEGAARWPISLLVTRVERAPRASSLDHALVLPQLINCPR